VWAAKFAILRAVIPFLHLGPLTIPTYGMMVALGLVGAFFVLRADLARRGIAAEAEMLIAIPALAGIAGAKLYHELETPQEFFAHPVEQLLSKYGLAWFGGMLGGMAAFVLLVRRLKIPLLVMLDAASPAAALGYGIGRMGCLLSGDGDYGIPTSLPWGMSFPNGLVPTTERVHPTPIYEFLVACAIAWWLWRLGTREIAASKPGNAKVAAASAGRIFAAYLIFTGTARFLVEFIRLNPRSFFGLTNAQAVSLLCIAGGIALLAIRRSPKTA
jgi:phosphatidylglycerol---prolipoprotein diacylglyceryl transferase